MQEFFGLAVTDSEFAEILAAYEDIAKEIMKLRSIDLSDIHPAVVFDPSFPYEEHL